MLYDIQAWLAFILFSSEPTEHGSSFDPDLMVAIYLAEKLPSCTNGRIFSSFLAWEQAELEPFYATLLWII